MVDDITRARGGGGGEGEGEGEGNPIQKGLGCSLYFLRVKKQKKSGFGTS